MSTAFAKQSYSQFGEDGVIAWILPPGDPNGHYIDVGCHHPFRLSNTAMLHLERGWSGLNIDADERAIEQFRLHRPHDINVCMGVGASVAVMDMAIFEDGAINSFSTDDNIHPAFATMPRMRRPIQVAPLAQIIRDFWPRDWVAQFLNVDAEGLDFDVLASNDWELLRPYCIAVEDDRLDLHAVQESKTFGLLSTIGYKLLSHVAITSFYIRT